MSQTARRPTRQRRALTQLMAEIPRFRSAQDIHGQLTATGTSVGLATVYRNLQAMAADGEIDVRRTEDGEALYRACSTGHHHHLICRACGRTLEIAAVEVEQWATRVATHYGFTEPEHVVEITGWCPDCASGGVSP